MNKYLLQTIGASVLAISILMLIPGHVVNAQFPYTETFKNSTASGMVFVGGAQLTSGIYDPVGEGYLRLTNNATNQTGSAYSNAIFNSNQGLVVEFEFFVHDGVRFPDPSGNTGDGFSFFLFNGDSAFKQGAYGGSLGYANKNLPPNEVIDGLGDGYIGIGLDEFGNFSSTYEGKNGGPGLSSSTIAIRGPGDGQGASYYVYQTGQQTTAAPFNFLLSDSTLGRDPLPAGAGYRKVRIEMSPVLSGTNVTGYNVTVKITTGGATPVEHTLINNYAYNFIPPPHLKFGFSASTGLATAYHEIRNLGVQVFDPTLLQVPVGVNDSVDICSGAAVSLPVTNNDYTPNGGGVPPYTPGLNIKRASIDFDTTTAGLQQSVTVAGEGTYTADTGGVITFMPVSGFTGRSQVRYWITDVYGITSIVADTIIIKTGTTVAPVLTVQSPQNTCAPGTIDITQNPAVWSANPAGGTVAYTIDKTGSIPISTPTAIDTTGTYYIKYTGTNGCVVIQPVDVTVSSSLSTVTASGNFICGAGNVTLQAMGAAAGEDYRWYDAASGGNLVQNNGDSYTTPVLSDTTSYWVSKYNTTVPACESSRTEAIAFINPLPVTANAGPDQTLTNVYTIQLAGNTPASGESGLWAMVSGPNTPSILEPTSQNAKVTGLAIGSYVFEWTTQLNTCTSADQVTVQVLSVLPVTLISFNATLKQQYVLLEWSTAIETDNNMFIIERSADGITFEEAGRVKGHGNSNQIRQYSFSDPVIAFNSQRIFYRLKQVDLDGHYEYSQILQVLLKDYPVQLIATPNPVHDQLHVRIITATGEGSSISIINTQGVQLKQYQYQLANGSNDLYLSVLGLPVGLYFLELKLNGRSMGLQKIVKY